MTLAAQLEALLFLAPDPVSVEELADALQTSEEAVGQAVKEAEGKIGAPVKIAGFVRYALGEGIEKQESDFAAEVAAASGKK